jgi:ADP-dependent NAD(P)H-hydrate dehydratase / NAD(P)H-hydrate epimerase
MPRLIHPASTPQPRLPLHSAAATRALELAAKKMGPQPSLMQRAGLAVARLALALAPHAKTVWVACGPGDNGGDGLVAAAHLQQWGKAVVLTWLGTKERASSDTLAAHAQALAAGVRISQEPPPEFDFAIDALLGIGLQARGQALSDGPLAQHLALLRASTAPVLSVDVPSGLDADSGVLLDLPQHLNATKSIAIYAMNTRANSRFCLNLLSLKPGVFTHQGKDAAGQVWLDDLGLSGMSGINLPASATAHLVLRPSTPTPRPHASHKGSYGDVLVLGGSTGMVGAALLAARAALHSGAGRVWLGVLAPENAQAPGLTHDSAQPELMLRPPQELLAPERLASAAVVCGCGGGQAVRAALPAVLHHAHALVLDADALNAIAHDSALQAMLQARRGKALATVLTPHPLEAARLLATSSAQVQAQRSQAAQQLADKFGAVVVLKGAGTVVAAPGLLPSVNATGSARLATAGTGDVLAGMMGGHLASGLNAPLRVRATGADSAQPSSAQPPWEDVQRLAEAAVASHGLLADQWPDHQSFTAQSLIR